MGRRSDTEASGEINFTRTFALSPKSTKGACGWQQSALCVRKTSGQAERTLLGSVYKYQRARCLAGGAPARGFPQGAPLGRLPRLACVGSPRAPVQGSPWGAPGPVPAPWGPSGAGSPEASQPAFSPGTGRTGTSAPVTLRGTRGQSWTTSPGPGRQQPVRPKRRPGRPRARSHTGFPLPSRRQGPSSATSSPEGLGFLVM